MLNRAEWSSDVCDHKFKVRLLSTLVIFSPDIFKYSDRVVGKLGFNRTRVL